jgi:hypothetical protein
LQWENSDNSQRAESGPQGRNSLTSGRNGVNDPNATHSQSTGGSRMGNALKKINPF